MIVFEILLQNNEIRVIECNLRASRSVPFVSKTFNVNFIDLATKIMVGAPVKASRIELIDIDHVVVKVPMFSFTRLQGADPVLRVEMASTGEVACFSSNPLEAYMKGLLATGSFRLPKKQRTILLSIGPHSAKVEFIECAQSLLRMGYTLYGTSGTATFYNRYGVTVIPLNKPDHLKRAVMRRRSSVGMRESVELEAFNTHEDIAEPSSSNSNSSESAVMVSSTASTPFVLTPKNEENNNAPSTVVDEHNFSPDMNKKPPSPETMQKQLPNILEVLKTGCIELVINVPNIADPSDMSAGYHIRRTAIDFSIPLISNMKNAIMLVAGLEMMSEPGFKFEIKSWKEYLRDAKIEA